MSAPSAIEGASAGAPPHERARPRVTWLGVARSPYNDFLFARLAEHFELTVGYQQRSLATHPWQLEDARYRVLYADDDLAACIDAARGADAVVMSGWSDWRWLVVMGWLRADRPKAFWTDTPDTRPRPGIKGLARAAVVRSVFLRFDEVWSTGRPGTSALAEIGCPQRKIRDFPFFVDLERPDRVDEASFAAARAFRAEHGGGGERVVFLAAGQLVARKRYADAIEAVARAGDRALLWVCGSGAEEPELRALARRNGAASRVFFLGWLQPAAMELAYLASDAFVHPAERDPFPTVVLDAMAWGRPVIGCAAAGSVADRVEPGQSGFVHRVGDVDRICAAMRTYVESSITLAQHQRRAREIALGHPVEHGVERVRALLARRRP